MFGKKSGVNSTIDSLVGATTRIDGDLHFEGGLRIDGQINGNVIAGSDQSSVLVISEHARVNGEIHVSHLIVNGVINGPVFATELLELQPKARVTGNVEYRILEMHHGAIVDGTLQYADPENRPGLKLASNHG